LVRRQFYAGNPSWLLASMKTYVGALMASAALFASSGAFMMAPSSLIPAALSSSCHAVSPASRVHGRFAPTLRPARRTAAAVAAGDVQMGVLDDILARKQKEVAALKESMPDDAAELLGKTTKHKNTFLKAIKKPKGTISIVGQMKIKQPNIGQFSDIPAPDFLSAHMYEAGAAACSMCCDKETYGFDYSDVAAVYKQQVRVCVQACGELQCVSFLYLSLCEQGQASSYPSLVVDVNPFQTHFKNKTQIHTASLQGQFPRPASHSCSRLFH